MEPKQQLPLPENKILIFQPDLELAKVVESILAGEGFEVLMAASGEEALKQVSLLRPKMVVLDVALPRLGGFEFCRRIRGSEVTPSPLLVVLTSGADEAEIAFTLGAADCVNKPVNLPELLVRIRRLLRPAPRDSAEENADEIAVEDLHLDIVRHQATVEGRPVYLTVTEFKLLRVLAQRRGRVQSRERLLQDVWDYNCALTTRTVDTHMRRLRQKLGQACGHLESVRGVGYRFADY